MATVVHNSKNSTTGFALNELLIGWEPPLSMEQRSESKNQSAEEYLTNMHCNRLMAIHALNKVAYKTDLPQNRWATGQLMWLEGKNLPLPYSTAKLAPRQHRPFKIDKIISPVAVRLELPTQWNIHPVFHTSLLTPYTETPSHGPNFTRPPPDLIDGEAEYKVEQIRSHRTWGQCKTLQYLIKWKGYPESDNTWENADQVHASDLIKLYHRTNAQRAIRLQRTSVGEVQVLNSPPFCHTIAHLCLLTTQSSSAATTAYLSPPKFAGPITTNSPVLVAGTSTAPSAHNHLTTKTSLKPTLSTSIPLTPQQDIDLSRHRLRPHHPTRNTCTMLTSLSSAAPAVASP
jgi:Chromo (CHRromatin Organisation MOdifier) domain